MTGEDIRRMRAEANVKAGELARRLGITAEHLSRMENGKKPVRPFMAFAIPAALSAQLPPPIRGEELKELFARCDWPVGEAFTFRDEPGAHDPCYVVMPGGAMLPLNHHNGEGVDIARAKFIIAACNAALAPCSQAIADAASHLEVCARLEEIGERREGPGNAVIHRRHAAALRAAALATPSSPDGWVLVPREPTEEMIEAFYHEEPAIGDDKLVCWSIATAMARGTVTRHLDERFVAAYHAMLAASPSSKENKS